MYLSKKVVKLAINGIAFVHPFFGITFFAAKKNKLPVGTKEKCSMDTMTKHFLTQYHKLDQSDYYFQPYNSNAKGKQWVNERYPSTGLQAINTQTFRDVFLHERGERAWGWVDNYVAYLENYLNTFSDKLPAFYLAVWLCRDVNWESDASQSSIIDYFFDSFNITEEEKQALFDVSISNITCEDLFQEKRVSFEDLKDIINPSPEEQTGIKKDLFKTTANNSSTHYPREAGSRPLNLIIYGAPGTGKTYSTVEYALSILEEREPSFEKKDYKSRKKQIDIYNRYLEEGRIEFVTFHQNYSYEDFIQGLKPDMTSESLRLIVQDGVFKRISDRALQDAKNKYVLIIDEINRGNISKIFGELITLIEDDKRWGELNQTIVSLPYGGQLSVPNNLYVIGTMNSADKSISLIDIALRRRFVFVEQQPDDSLVEDPSLRKFLHSINLLLAKELESTDLLIGHSYFMNKDVEDLPQILNNSIIPLLYEYFYDNRKKVASILNGAIAVSNVNIEIVDNRIARLCVQPKGDTDDTEQV